MNWDLSYLYKGFDDPDFERDMSALKDETAEALIEISASTHENEAHALKSIIKRLNSIASLSGLLGNMIFLTMAADAHDESALKWNDKFMKLEAEQSKLISAVERYVLAVNDIDSVLAKEPALKEYEYAIKKWREEASHTIAPEIESAVLDMQLTGGRAWAKLRDELDATHTVEYVKNSNKTTITLSEARSLAYDPDPDVRKAAYEAEIASYSKIEQPMSACLNAIKGEAITMAKLMKYDSVLDWSLYEARITRPILDALISSIEKSLPIFRSYLKIKAKALGYEGGLPFYDLFAPLGKAGKTYTLDSARELIESTIGRFSPGMSQTISRAFDKKLIDAYPRPGKQGGAFCSGVYARGISYILSNFDGSLSSVSTLAHELGHAYHDRLLFKNGAINSEPPMTLAETASIFNETLLTGELIKNASDDQKLMILDQELTDATQTVVDILSRFYFEKEVLLRREDSYLAPEELCSIMLESQKKAYGDGLSVYHPYMWACKSHYYGVDFHFYNFPYAFGLLFGKGIYALYKKEGAGFYEKYERLLAATAVGDADAVAGSVGIDLANEEFWLKSLNEISTGVNELQSIYQSLD